LKGLGSAIGGVGGIEFSRIAGEESKLGEELMLVAGSVEIEGGVKTGSLLVVIGVTSDGGVKEGAVVVPLGGGGNETVGEVSVGTVGGLKLG
jgi:hypothetical protein